jgi:hypothetical protein
VDTHRMMWQKYKKMTSRATFTTPNHTFSTFDTLFETNFHSFIVKSIEKSQKNIMLVTKFALPLHFEKV